MISKITMEEVETMRKKGKDGLVFSSYTKPLQEWLYDINAFFTEEGILLEGDTFQNVYTFENNRKTNIFLDMGGVKLNLGKLAVWKLKTWTFLRVMWFREYMYNITFQKDE